MANITLKENQSALILGAADDGIQVDLAYGGEPGLAAEICEVLARLIVEDEMFREEVLNRVAEKIG